MKHLTEDQLYHLAELSCDAELLNPEEEQQLEHVKSCRECFEQYCVFGTILDATSLNSSLIFDSTALREKAASPVRKILASLKVTYRCVQDTVTLLGEQIQQNIAAFAFEPVLSSAVRGSRSRKTSILRMEDIEDEGTCFVYDAENHKIMLQFTVKNNEFEKIKAYLQFEDQSIINIPLERKGVYLKGILSNVPSGSFEVRIEET
ncbi:hypothetical protein B5F53_16015 [Blautia sp. An249]|uniref:hypothetical protein n=1 Tax=Blautia sp. An249 TaxID=1965603 RepID=UPI000B3655E2|nr:hypothetical protein [Blautia sp. An249]OUO76754.1 hypothetical protein B5F53_16015 [Blautia sp. An249]